MHALWNEHIGHNRCQNTSYPTRFCSEARGTLQFFKYGKGKRESIHIDDIDENVMRVMGGDPEKK